MPRGGLCDIRCGSACEGCFPTKCFACCCGGDKEDRRPRAPPLAYQPREAKGTTTSSADAAGEPVIGVPVDTFEAVRVAPVAAVPPASATLDRTRADQTQQTGPTTCFCCCFKC